MSMHVTSTETPLFWATLAERRTYESLASLSLSWPGELQPGWGDGWCCTSSADGGWCVCNEPDMLCLVIDPCGPDCFACNQGLGLCPCGEAGCHGCSPF